MNPRLTLTTIEIENDKKPNWQAARDYVNSLTDQKIIDLYNTGLDEDNRADARAYDIDIARHEIEGTIIMVEKGWNGEQRDIVVLNLSRTNLLIAGYEPWSDYTDGYSEINDFVRYGLAKIAGFIVEKEE